MRELGFFRNVTIGQYRAGTSLVHRLTPATKYLWLLALAFPAAALGFLPVAAVGLAALAIAGLAGLRPAFLLRGVVPALPFLALAALLQFAFSAPGDRSPVLFALGPFSATLREARGLGLAILRTLSLLVILGLFTSVTREAEISHGLEDLLRPLGRLGFPVHGLALVVAMTFRFIPIVAGELEAIVKAQASRGADFGSGRGGPLRKARAYLPLLVPLVVRSLERAEALGEAMEARCYSGEGRTRLAAYEGVGGETWLRLLALLAFAAAVAADIFL